MQRDDRLAAELDVGLVDDDQGVERADRFEFRAVDRVAGRVVRRREEHDPCAIVDGVANGDDVEVEVRAGAGTSTGFAREIFARKRYIPKVGVGIAMPSASRGE